MELSDSLSRQLSRDPATEWLFNNDQLLHYKDIIQQGLSVIERHIQDAHKPWSGINAKQLAPKLSDIQLDRPLFSVTEALAELDEIYLQHAVYFHHPRYAAHLNCPIAYPALLGELISSAINTSVDTWDQSAGATLIEQKLVDWTISLLGLGEQADGIFTSGGSQSNLMALLLARDHFCRHQLGNHCVKHCGLPSCSSQLRIFCSEASHFSIQKSAAIIGLGYQSVISIPTDAHYRMDSKALAAAIEQCRSEGLLPMAIVATAGTTDFGSIDPLHAIADLAQREDLWLHVDAAYGCGLLASNHQRHKLSGIERAHSVTVDYHKSFLQPVACSAFFSRIGSQLSAVTHHAEYLNPLSAQQEGTPNLVNKSLQTTRRFDALKLWLTLRICGLTAIGQAFDRACDNAQIAYALLAGDNDFEVLHKPEISTLVFRFCPTPALHLAGEAPPGDEQLNDLNDEIRRRLLASGEAMVAGTRIGGRRYLKFTFLNPACSQGDIGAMIALIREHGHTLSRERQGGKQHARL